jgi:hypothetical protein
LRAAEAVLRERHAVGGFSPLDETRVLFAVGGFNGDAAERRFLLQHFYPPRAGYFVQLWDESPGLVVTPRWVHDLVARQSGDIRHTYRSRGKAVSAAHPVTNIDVELVHALWEPGSTGPLSSLAEAVSAARLLA